MQKIYRHALLLSEEDIMRLSQIFEQLFEYYYHVTTHNQYFLAHLRTVLGLGFTAVLKEQSYLSSYLNRLEIFLYAENNAAFPQAPLLLPQAISEMIDTSSYIFHVLNYPDYYVAYRGSLKRLLRDIAVSLTEMTHQEAVHLLKVLGP